MAKLGFRTLDSLVGRTDLLKFAPVHPKAALLDLSAILCDANRLMESSSSGTALPPLGSRIPQDFALGTRKEAALLGQIRHLIKDNSKNAESVVLNVQLCNRDRAFGTTISHEIALACGETGLAKSDAIVINANGSAGQSLAAFLAHGVTIRLEGDANDYVCRLLLIGGQHLTEQFSSRLAKVSAVVGSHFSRQKH